MTGNIKVTLENKGPVTLNSSNHKATGGEGSIYKLSDMAIKIYTDKNKIQVDKINLLKILQHNYIVAPEGLVFDNKNTPLGYYMKFNEGTPLSILFTNEFYKKENFTSQYASVLVNRMKEVFIFSHEKGAILVDPNELNWLIAFPFNNPEPRIVDVDSWMIGKYPASVIMPSIRDWNNLEFNEKSDWFSWGIITFQIYTGIHPYKGTIDGYSRSDLEKRMKDKISVFTKGVRLNQNVRDFTHIPNVLLNWYEATFQTNERTLPPSPFDKVLTTPKQIQILRAVTTNQTGLLIFEKLLEIINDPIIKTFHCGIVLTQSKKLIDIKTKKVIFSVKMPNCEVIRIENGWGIIELENTKLIVNYIFENNLQANTITMNLITYNLLRYENRIFAVTEQGLSEIQFTKIGDKIFASVKQTWGILINSTNWFEGFGIIDAMGAKFIVTPFSNNAATQIRVKEIDNLRIVSGKSGNKFISLIGIDKKGEYNKIEITFDIDYRNYKIWIGIAENPELNISILPKGVCATIVKDGELIIFVPTNGKVTKINDKGISTEMILSNWEDKVIYIQNESLWSTRMK